MTRVQFVLLIKKVQGKIRKILPFEAVLRLSKKVRRRLSQISNGRAVASGARVQDEIKVASLITKQISISAAARNEILIMAENLVDPVNGVHQLEWADASVKYRWTGAAPVFRLLEPINRSAPHRLYFNLLSVAEGIDSEHVRCIVDGEELPLSLGNDSGFMSLMATAPKSTKKFIEIELRSPLITESGGERRLGLALVSISLRKS